jgi:hypothetical protein
MNLLYGKQNFFQSVRVTNGMQLWRLAANMLNEQTRTADKERSSSLVEGLTNIREST